MTIIQKISESEISNIITDEQFEQLLRTVPSTTVALDYDGSEGTYSNSDHEIECDGFFIVCDLWVKETGTTTHATYFNPSSYNSDILEVEVGDIQVSINDREDILGLSEVQLIKLANAITVETE